MEFVTVGTTSSLAEFRSVMDRLEGDRMYQAVELLESISKIEITGFAGESARWDEVPGQPAVKVYFGVPERGSTTQGGIWAAIEIGADGKSAKVLKITDTYSGDRTAYDGFLQDAIHRRDRSKRP